MESGGLGVAQLRPAVVTIDLHRGHLDDIATLPLDRAAARRVVDANIAFLGEARRRGVPVVHVVTEYRTRDEIASNPFWHAISGTNVTRGNMMSHNLSGSPGTELMPGIQSEGDVVVGGKRRYDCFNATDLEFTLRNFGVNTLLITGVNTNSCVLATTIIASTKDFGCVVISDCVETVDGPDLHRAALTCIGRAFGWVSSSDEIFATLQEAGWKS
ncbi:MAG: cysteine hydrolase family protein [Actinomycetota bacterium]